MKNKRFLLLFFLSFLIILLVLSNNLINKPPQTFNDFNEIENNNLKKGDSWILSPFIIDDTGGGDYTWAQAASQEWCSGGGTQGNPYIIENVTINGQNAGSCIEVRNSNKYFIIRDCTLFNAGQIGGSVFEYGGIRLEKTSNGIMKENNLSNNEDAGIVFYESCTENTISNNIINDNGQAMDFYYFCDDNLISENLINNNWAGLSFGRSYRNTLIKNNITHNSGGIYLYDEVDCDILYNNISYNDWKGISITLFSDNIDIKYNSITNNEYGIYIDQSDNTNVSLNLIHNNTKDGVYIEHWSSWDNIISRNNITFNMNNGIYLDNECYRSAISNNNISYNKENGVFIDQDCDRHEIHGNSIKNNIKSGIIINDTNSQNNLIYNNTFAENLIVNAIDNGSNNNWNNTIVGNFWSDYYGNDLNDDGIGDVPFNISGSAGAKDYIPIWDDGDDTAPTITINSPYPNQVFNDTTPNYNIETSDVNIIDKIWYTIDDGIINITIASNGSISQTEWDKKEDGTVNIKFFANDTDGNLGFNEVNVIKDTKAPEITIVSPVPNQLFGNETFNFELNIIEANSYTANYSLNGGLNYTFTGTSGTINQIAWDACGNGTVTLRFYVIDVANNMSYQEVTVRKDIKLPQITIISPEPYELFGNKSLDFEIAVDAENLNKTWYSLNGSVNYFFSGFSGTINQTEWNTFGNGTITIRFYANDSQARLSFKDVIVYKDIIAPSITINLPKPNEFYSTNPPDFSLIINEPHINTTWYSLNGGLNYPFVGTTGTINQTAWDACGNGTVTIRFYANDTVSNTGFEQIVVKKDIYSPDITIVSPTPHQIFGNSSPYFELSIIERNLNTTWYSLNGSTKYFFTGLSGTINQTEWETFGNGTITIRFYANDSAGNINFAEATILKDIYPPDITIISPTLYQVFGNSSPYFELSINEPNLNTTWYSLNGSTKYFFTGLSGTINQTEWETFGNGTITIRFYANDTLSNTGYTEVIVKKDIYPPDISIVIPTYYQLFGNSSPYFELFINEPNLNKTWYSLNDGLNYTFTGASGWFNQIAWDACGNGTVNIFFYANDTVGNFAFKNITVRKDTSFPNITIISPSAYQLFGNETFNFELSIIEPNLNTTWYSLNGGTNYTFTGTTGTINKTAWDACGNGTVTIRFYANNTAGNIANEEIVVHKDEMPPIITIITPSLYQLFGNITFNFELIINEANLNTTWYSLNGGTNYTFTGTTGTINQTAWDACGNGTVTIRFYANDTVSNIGYEEVVVRKDIYPPDITIVIPTYYQLFGNSSPYFELSINEPNLNTTWYSLNDGLNYTFTGVSGWFNQIAWDACGNGTVNIFFYANDTVGNFALKNITVHKDTSFPNITIISPTPYTEINSISPDFDLLINDPKLNTTWYSLNGDLNYTFTGTTGTINQTAWDACSNGTVKITFYANNTAGNLAFSEVIVLKGPIILETKTAYAIVIGIEIYQYLSPLSFSVNDASSINTYLRLGCNFKTENVILLINSGATNTDIAIAFGQIDSKIDSDDIFFFFFAGHGGEDGGSHFICPYDSNPSFPSTFLYDTELDAYLDLLNCAEIYVVIDACNSGGMISESQTSGRYMMTACEAWELSWETSSLGHGVFTYFFLESSNSATDSNGDNVISMEEMYSYAYTETVAYSTGLGSAQHPDQYDGITGQTIYHPSLGSLTLTPNENQLDFLFYLYGNGYLKTLNLLVCSITPTIAYQIIDLTYFSPSNTGFGYYSGTIIIEQGYNITGYEILAEIDGYNLRTIKQTFGDTDGDGLYDIFEIFDGNGIDPSLNDTDFDGLNDYDEFYGITNPLVNDTDDDGLLDGLEVNNYFTNPLLNDTDSDGLSDGLEVYNYTTDPTKYDTDGDGYSDGWEVTNGYDPLDPNDHPPSGGGINPSGGGGGGGGGGGSSEDPIIPLGNFYLIFLFIGLISLTILKKRDLIIKNNQTKNDF